MLNELSDAKSARFLPAHLLPLMRQIFHQGLHQIMLVSLILLILAVVCDFYFNFGKEKGNFK